MQVTRLNNPPITEALIDFRVNLPEETTLERLAKYKDFVLKRFSKREERIEVEAGVEFRKGEFRYAPIKGKVNGYIFRSQDGRKVFQSRLDGFTFSVLKPYESWEKLREETREIWTHYIEIARPINVSRIAVRYINRIEIPLPVNDFKEYILTVPEIAQGLPQAMSESFFRLIIANEHIKAAAIITERVMPGSQDAKTVPVIFDIDVFRFEKLKPDDINLWKLLEDLRSFKNDIFFKSLTDKAMELFK